MTDHAIAQVRELEKKMLALPQLDIPTEHVLHGGMYTRTIFVPAGSLVTGVVVKVPTTLIVSGDVWIFIAGKAVMLQGYNVFAASAHRKQAVYAITDACITMSLVTNAKSIEDAEEVFTDEVSCLGSRRDSVANRVLITGE